MATSKETYYSWTDIVVPNDDGKRDIVKPGTKVSKSDFSEEDWDQLVESRAVRTRQFPDIPADFGGSPREWMVKQMNEQLEAAEDMLADEDLSDENQAVDTGMTGEDSE